MDRVVIREGTIKKNLNGPPDTERPPPPNSQVVQANDVTTIADAGLVTREQLAAQFKVVEETIWRWEREGMPVKVNFKNVHLYKLVDVLKWMERAGKKRNRT